jgi:hypothetical protein
MLRRDSRSGVDKMSERLVGRLLESSVWLVQRAGTLGCNATKHVAIGFVDDCLEDQL